MERKKRGVQSGKRNKKEELPSSKERAHAIPQGDVLATIDVERFTLALALEEVSEELDLIHDLVITLVRGSWAKVGCSGPHASVRA